MLTTLSVNCRLPQTPRTPATAAAHYFDDVFMRQRRQSLGGRRPTGLARSMSASRSIGNRSDIASTNGDVDDDADGEAEPTPGGPSRQWSIYNEDANAGIPKPEDDPDDPINRYVQDQLARIKSNESAEFSEELAAQNDGANDEA